jgi:hypothetical protein
MKPQRLFDVRRVVHGGSVVWISFVASERLRYGLPAPIAVENEVPFFVRKGAHDGDE